MKTKFVVSSEEAGMKLQHYLHKKISGDLSLKQIKKALEKGYCEVNGRKVHFASFILAVSDSVVFHVSALHEEETIPKVFEKGRVLYLDDALLIYNKPQGVVSDGKGILSLLKKEYNPLYLVHRLDKDTSGAMAFARTKPVLDAMIELFRQHKIAKEYLSIIDGVPKVMRGVINHPVVPIHSIDGRTLWGVDTKRKQGTEAITEWELLHKGTDCAMVLCRPITGRTHQLRVHLRAIGHPILGDPLYGKRYRCTFVPKRLMLHAWKLSFPHPIEGGKRVDVEAPVPEDMANAENKLFQKG